MRQFKQLVDKTQYKAAWDVRKHLRPAPKISVVHERRHNNYPDIWHDLEYVHRVEGPVYIDPQYGWVVTEDGVLVEESMNPQLLYKPAWRNGLPSPKEFQTVLANPKRLVETGEVVSLRHFWEYNYYHFHLDVLGKLNLFRQVGVPSDVPLVLGRYVPQLGWPEQIIRQGQLGSKNFLIPDLENQTWIKAAAVYYCRTSQGYRERMDPVLDLMGVPVPSAQYDYAANKGRRIFLTRRPPATRCLSNAAEVEKLLSEYDFEVIDTSGMGIDDQIRLFNEARLLIALHGAGLTNILYRRGAPMFVLELHAEGFVSKDMANMCLEYGYGHAQLAGQTLTNPPILSDYRIDCTVLHAYVRRMVDEADSKLITNEKV